MSRASAESHRGFHDRVCGPRFEGLTAALKDFREFMDLRFDQHAKLVSDRLDRRDSLLMESIGNGWGSKIAEMGSVLREEFRSDVEAMGRAVKAVDSRLWVLLSASGVSVLAVIVTLLVIIARGKP